MTDDWAAAARAIADPLRRKLFVAAVASERLRKEGQRLVVVGGTAVEWHTVGLYRSGDIDVLAPWDALDRVLRGMSFEREGRHWYREDLGVAIEAPGTELESYRDRTEDVEAEGLRVTLIGVEEAVLDRLRACVHWQSELDCEQAVHMMVLHRDRLDWRYLEQRAVRDQVQAKFAEARKRAESALGDADPTSRPAGPR